MDATVISEVSGIIGILFRVYDYWREYKNSKKEVYIPEPHEFISESIQDIRNDSTDKLMEIRIELIHNGELSLAKKLDQAIDEIWRLPEESYILLESYLRSNEFYKNTKK